MVRTRQYHHQRRFEKKGMSNNFKIHCFHGKLRKKREANQIQTGSKACVTTSNFAAKARLLASVESCRNQFRRKTSAASASLAEWRRAYQPAADAKSGTKTFLRKTSAASAEQRICNYEARASASISAV